MKLNLRALLPKPLNWNRNFILLSSGQFISILGDRMYQIALMWLSYRISNSALIMGMVAMFNSIPYFAVSFFAGAIIDKGNKKNIMIISDVLRALIVLIIPILYYTKSLQIWNIMVMTLLLSCASQFFSPALKSIFPIIVEPEKLVKSNSSFTFFRQLASIIGPGLAGILLSFISEVNFFIFDSFTFVVSAVSIYFIRINSVKEVQNLAQEGKEENIKSHITETLKFLIQDKILLLIIIFGAVSNFFLNGIMTVLTPIFSNSLSSVNGSKIYGLIVSLFSFGMLTGSMILNKFDKIRLGYLFMISFLGSGISFLLIGFNTNITIIYILFFFFGIFIVTSNISFDAFVQKKSPQYLMGTIFSIVFFLTMGSAPISHMLVGYLSEFILPSYFYLSAGAILVIFGIANFLYKKIREAE